MPEGTEREAIERQGQNWSGKNVLPNFSMKIKVRHLFSLMIDYQLKLTRFYDLMGSGVPLILKSIREPEPSIYASS